MSKIEEAYNQYDIELRAKRLKITIPLATLFIMLFSFLDLTFYPKVAIKLIISRAVSDLFLIITFYAIFRKNWIKDVKFAGVFVVTLIFIQINVLIFITGESSSSPYYAGLSLTVVALSALLPWVLYETLLICCVMITTYMLNLILHSIIFKTEYLNAILVNNLFFLVSTSVFCIVANHLNAVLRFKEFCLNYELEEKNIKLRSTQAQLIQSEKINAIGSLSAGLLHEVNNPLNYTMTALQLIKMDPHVNSDADLKDTVSDIEEGMTRIKNIVTDLRAFAYPEEADKKNSFAFYEAVESTLRFTASECQDIVRIVNVPKDLMVTASKTHIVQVLINLISNGAKAIYKTGRGKGEIVIDARKSENGRVNISVSDDGIGMNEETLNKVFDPFFTTNEVGKGMGLGLSVSYTIIKNHGGNLAATSELGKGSKFYFDLPN